MTTVWCRPINRFFSSKSVRRLLSVPLNEHQTDAEGYIRRPWAEETGFLDEFGRHAEVAGGRVLDLGCGLGARTVAVAGAGAATTVGVDNDVGKIHRARRLSRRLGTPSVSFTVQSGTRLAFDAGRFDVILMLDVIEHLKDPSRVLAECARVLRPGGRVLIGFPPYRSPWGGHLFSHVPIPWVQLIFSDREVLEVWREVFVDAVARGEVACSAKRSRAIMEARNTNSLWDCNGMTIARFLDLVERTPLRMSSIRFKTLGGIGGPVTRQPWLREHLVTRVIAVLET